MINSDADFLDVVEKEEFIGNTSLQDKLFWYGFNPISIRKLSILWLIQQSHSVCFSHISIEKSYLELASIEELIHGLSVFKIKPTSFVERVLNEGSVEQIERVNRIIKGVVNE